MICIDEDALYCDFVETYGILEFRQLKVEQAAKLAAGLRSNSRIRAKAMNMEQPLDTYLYALQLDALRLLLWTKTKDAEKNKNKPKSIAQLFNEQKEPELKGYSTIDEFRAARNKILGETK